MKKYLWASPHEPTNVQLEELAETGNTYYLRKVNPELQARLEDTPEDLQDCYELIIELYSFVSSNGYTLVQPAGNPMFQYLLGKYGKFKEVLYAYSKRVAVEEILPDGKVVKKSLFKHERFIQA